MNDLFVDLIKKIANRREKELYAAWRADYDFLYTLQHWPPHGGVPKFGFVPSNNPNLEFQEFNSSCYDLRFDIDVIATPDGEGTFLKKAMATK